MARVLLLGGLFLAALVLFQPDLAHAHGFGERYDLPVPLWLYLYGAGATVLVSFVVVGHVPSGQARRPRRSPFQPLPTARPPARAGERPDADPPAVDIRGDPGTGDSRGLLGESRLDTELLGGVHLGGVVGGVGLRVLAGGEPLGAAQSLAGRI